MKNRYLKRVLLALVATILALLVSSCGFEFLPFSGQQFADDLSTEEEITAVNEATGTTAIPEGFTVTGYVLDFLNQDAQAWSVTFESNNGEDLFIDEDTISTGLTVYPVEDPATDTPNQGDLVVRGAAIPFTVTSVTYNSEVNIVRGTIDLSQITTDTLEFVLSPTALTANGGTTLLNLDGDDTPGEEQDDLGIVYTDPAYDEDGGGTDYVIARVTQSTEAGATTLTSVTFGAFRNPQGQVITPNYTAGVDQGVSGPPEITWLNVNDTDFENDGTAMNLTAAGVAAGITVESMGATIAEWAAVAMGTPTLDATTGAFTYSYATAPGAAAAGTVYRAIVDGRAITESDATLGYVHRGRIQADAEPQYWYWFVASGGGGNWDSLTGAPNPEFANGRAYFDLDFQGDTGEQEGVDIRTLSNTSLFIARDNGDRWPRYNWESFEVLDPTELNVDTSVDSEPYNNITVVRFWMPVDFAPGGDNYRVIVTPELMNGLDNVNTTDQNEAAPFGDPTPTDDWQNSLPYDDSPAFSWSS